MNSPLMVMLVNVKVNAAHTTNDTYLHNTEEMQILFYFTKTRHSLSGTIPALFLQHFITETFIRASFVKQ